MTSDLETLKMSAIQKGTANSQYRNDLKDFTAQTTNKGTANTNLPSTKSYNKLNSIGVEPTITIHSIKKFRSSDYTLSIKADK